MKNLLLNNRLNYRCKPKKGKVKISVCLINAYEKKIKKMEKFSDK